MLHNLLAHQTRALRGTSDHSLPIISLGQRIGQKAAHDRFSQTGILRDAGIPLRPDRHYAIFHHKFIVIDGATLETGSFNYTTAAIKHNAENAIVLWNAPTIAEAYAAEWQRLWGESVDAKQ